MKAARSFILQHTHAMLQHTHASILENAGVFHLRVLVHKPSTYVSMH